MKFLSRKKMVLVIVIILSIVIVGLWQTYALNVYLEEGTPSTYDMALNFELSNDSSRQLTVEAGKTKIFNMNIANPYNSSVRYGVAYSLDGSTTLSEGVIIANSWMSANDAVGLLEANSKASVSIIVINNTNASLPITFSIISGYKNGGDLILQNGQTLITETHEKYDVTLISPDGITIPNSNTATNLIINGSFENGSNNWWLDNAQVVNTQYSNGSHSLVLLPNVLAMTTQVLRKTIPTLNHLYYGRLKFLSTSNFTTADNRFEWYYTDATNAHMVFAYKTVATTNWTLLSNISSVTGATYLSSTWQIRNFEVNANANSYVDELVIIDLTETFGAGNEPTKEWLDQNINYFDETLFLKTVEVGEGMSTSLTLKPKSGYTVNSINCTNNQTATISGNVITINKVSADTVCTINS